MGEERVIDDFLPSPDKLALKEDTIKVTIALSRSSVEFFKQQAIRYKIPYQRMIRRLLDDYTNRYTR